MQLDEYCITVHLMIDKCLYLVTCTNKMHIIFFKSTPVLRSLLVPFLRGIHNCEIFNLLKILNYGNE